ncbi:SusD/RagB family nutrient-binding outer membrane lipoprotein [Chitinophaga sp. 30R24]|uniref:SusD/RagB family nutrient-binding outer membrane lipoprotein n=1 Tax=Chitinophaga sp. 30R24 TaxID=3248838 RepID=UPI003B90B645
MKLFKQKIFTYSLTAALLVMGVGCKKYLDINTDPTKATKVEPKLLFGYAITAYSETRCSGDGWLPLAFMSQAIATGGSFGWGQINDYDISTYSLGNVWKGYYNTSGNNLQLAIKTALSSTPVNNNAIAQCKIVLAELVYEATTLYGDVPYSEAWNANFPYPHYDKQKDVLENVIKLLDEAVAQFDESQPNLIIKDYDLFYNGDIAKWKKLATSLKFRTLMLMVDADPSKAAAIGTLLAKPEAMIASAAEAWKFPYGKDAARNNPKYRLINELNGGENNMFLANKAVIDYMLPKNDPRIPQYFEPGADGQYRGVGTDQEADENDSYISSYLQRADAPDLLCSYQEILFLQAEAYARGLGVTKDLAKAQTLYKQALTTAMTFYEADPADIQTYMSSQLADLTTIADPVAEIHLQQWIDLMDRPLEGFTQWRRSGPDGQEVPALTVPPQAPSGGLIRRWGFAPDEISANINIPKPAPLYSDKMWFDL